MKRKGAWTDVVEVKGKPKEEIKILVQRADAMNHPAGSQDDSRTLKYVAKYIDPLWRWGTKTVMKATQMEIFWIREAFHLPICAISIKANIACIS